MDGLLESRAHLVKYMCFQQQLSAALSAPSPGLSVEESASVAATLWMVQDYL